MLYLFLHKLVRLTCRIIYRVHVIGLENVPKNGPVLICPNHISNFDPPVLASTLDRQIHFMAKAELFKVPLFGKLITQLGSYPVERGNGDNNAIQQSIRILAQNKVVTIFPEGTRSKTGVLKEGKTGAAQIALASGTPIIPTAIISNYRLFGPVWIIFCKPIQVENYGTARELNEEVARLVTNDVMEAIRLSIQNAKVT
ncbi:1-acyl-sn-glycerol-3-phosphate acyltransferase [Hazenella sp. IB182357]|uniref:1-acyl-sn-glycerol-3-phosphate acyltransferase n=1 Tax=Polycladospora coralii TaxID=2771432 RepID=A0A926NDV8_9BACL|nr:lysophospholipid acyltransferase family protein [Polycladospora coralii]MBD1371643.1 1-acyl-sn-glycerol-3-phosphate acyltransferase [Polycladospora coralii]MBS7529110.1 1-acyl-sn-glycerol-3-phosphate acyltransferase [Polycladospora coralii]